MSPSSLERAVALVGSQSALARALGKQPGHVWWWLRRSGRAPAEYVIAIESATNGRVTRHELRPDIYPTPDGVAT